MLTLPGLPPIRSLQEEACRQAAIERQERELATKASLIRYQVCQPKCQFSRTCNKRGQAVLDCATVRKWQPQVQEMSP